MSSSAESSAAFAVGVMALEYRDLAAFSASGTATGRPHGTRFADGNGKSHADDMLSKAEADERINLARAEAALQARQEYAQKLEAARASIATALRAFETERAE